MARSEIPAKPSPGAAGDDLIRLRQVAQDRTVENAIEAVREFLGMDVAFATRMTDSRQLLETMRGDGESFGIEAGGVLPLEQTYCQRVLAGRLPNVMPDVRGDERTASMPVTEAAGVGAFVSVPLTFSDGTLHGTLCAASHEAMPSLGYRELQFLHVFARMVSDQLEREGLESRANRLEKQLTATAALMSAVEARDAYTADHSREVVKLAEAVAAELGLAVQETECVSLVALLHDIGKISIPDAILSKPGPLDAEEWEQMRLHPVHGERVVSRIPGLEHLAAAMRAEHERWDGNGYPDGLAGDAIPITSRVVLACDAYHAMISDRPYRPAMSAAAARAELADNAGSQFDPAVVTALLGVLAGPGDA